MNFTNITRAEKLNIVSNSEVHCSANLIHAYRNINYPDEPSFCDAESLDLAGKTVYTYTSSATPSPTPSASSVPTHYNPTPSGGKLAPDLQGGIAVVAIVAGGLLIGGFIMKYRRKNHKRNDATNVTTRGLTAGTAAVSDADATGGHSEALPRHSADEAPPPYSRAPPGK